MGQVVATSPLLENKYVREYAQIVGRLPGDDDWVTPRPHTEEYTLVSLEIYQCMQRIDRGNKQTHQHDQPDFDYCQRCSIPVTDPTLPYLHVSRAYIVCFRCYARDRIHHLSQYLLLCDQIFSADVAMSSSAGKDLTLILHALVRLCTLSGGSAALCENINVQDIANNEGTLRELWIAGFVSCWYVCHSFSLVYGRNDCDDGRCAYVIGPGERNTREVRVYYGTVVDGGGTRWCTTNGCIFLSAPDDRCAFAPIWRAVVCKMRDIGTPLALYPYDVTKQQQQLK